MCSTSSPRPAIRDYRHGWPMLSRHSTSLLRLPPRLPASKKPSTTSTADRGLPPAPLHALVGTISAAPWGLRAVAGGGANVISLATPPTSPSGMSLSTAALIGICWARDRTLARVPARIVGSAHEDDRGVRARLSTAGARGNPPVGFRAGQANERTAQLEPYRILRSALDFAAVARPVTRLLITSAVSGEGKTTVAVDLAHAIALTGRPVVLAEFDLRRPMFGRHFNFSSHDGLTTALANGERVTDLLVKPFSELPNLSILRAGRLPPNPSELLGTRGCRAGHLRTLQRRHHRDHRCAAFESCRGRAGAAQQLGGPRSDRGGTGGQDHTRGGSSRPRDYRPSYCPTDWLGGYGFA